MRSTLWKPSRRMRLFWAAWKETVLSEPPPQTKLSPNTAPGSRDSRIAFCPHTSSLIICTLPLITTPTESRLSPSRKTNSPFA